MLTQRRTFSLPMIEATHRISIDRMRRHVLIPEHARRARFAVGAVLLIADLAVLGLGTWLRTAEGPTRLGFALGPSFLTLVLPALLGCYLAGGYRLSAVRREARFSVLATAAAIGAVVGIFAFKFAFARFVGQETVVRFTVATAIAAPAFAGWVVATRWLARRILIRREALSKLIVIGSTAMAIELTAELRRLGITHPMVVLDDDGAPSPDAVPGLERLPLAELDAQLSGAVKAVVLARPVSGLPPGVVQDLVHARLMNIPVTPLSLLFEELWERTPVTAQDPAWFLQEDRLHPSRSFFHQGGKRLLDIAFAGLGLVLAAPLLAIVAVLVRASSPGPIFFTQTRLGLWKKPFTICKFRTMRADAEGDGRARWATANDSRITPIGRFLRRTRLDELPQLWNVLVGDMSIVGPRPERPEFTERLEQVIPYYDLRHLVKTGLTGWAQVCYPYGSSVDDAVAKLEYEIYYIKNASFRFELRILLRTIGIVLSRSGC